MLKKYTAVPILILIACTWAFPAVAAKRHKNAGHGAGASLMGWFKRYYAYQDSSWQTLDITRAVSRTTSDYVYQDEAGTVGSRDQVIAMYQKYFSDFAQDGISVTVHTTITHLSVNGDTAIVDIVQRGHASKEVNEDNTAIGKVFAEGAGFRQRDTWVHLAGGWYLASSEDRSQETNVTTNGRVY